MNNLRNAVSKAWQSVLKGGAGGAPQVPAGASAGVSVLIALGLGTYGAYHSVVTVQPGHRGIVYNRLGGLQEKKSIVIRAEGEAKSAELIYNTFRGTVSRALAFMIRTLLENVFGAVTVCDEKTIGVGLLTGMDTMSLSRAAPHYSTTLNIAETKEFMVGVDHIHKASLQDATANYDSYVARAVAFAPKIEFYDRTELVEHMKSIITGAPGSFVCILGGKSTGKSKLVASLSAAYPASIIAIDCRNSANIVASLVAAIAAKEDGSMDTLKKVLLGVARDVAPSASNTLDAIYTPGPAPTLPQLIDTIIANAERPITIIIDEANIALSTSGGAETLAATRAALALFTRITKQTLKVNVVLVSSEHTYPYKLTSGDVGFNMLDLGSMVLYAGEVPPAEMYHLLTERWLVPHNLAVSLMSTYGGHIHDTILALKALANGAKSGRAVEIRLDAQLGSAVMRCLNWRGKGQEDRDRMRAILRDLAIQGFSQLVDDNDPVAEQLISSGVAGMVTVQSPLVVGLDRSLWDRRGSDYGLIPLKQSMRLAIARFI